MRVYSASTEHDAKTLRVASRLVDHLLRGHVYDVDDDGMPTDPDVVSALTDATDAIAAELESTGALESASTVEWDNVKIGSVALSGPHQSASAVTVAGIGIPVAALVALADVGTLQVYVGARPYVRPLLRVT